MNKTGLRLIFEDWKAPAGVSLVLVEYCAKGAVETNDIWYADPAREDPEWGGPYRLFEPAGENPELRALVSIKRGQFDEYCVVTMPCTDVLLDNVSAGRLAPFFHEELTNILKHGLEARQVSPAR